MSTSTRQKKADLWKYLVGTVMDDDNGILSLTLKHHSINYLHQVLVMSKVGINNLKYIDPTDSKEKRAPEHVVANLHIIQAWNIHLQNTLQTPIVDWNDKSIINEDTFDEYRISIFDPHAPK